MTRYIAHITIEAETPLRVGSNATDFLQDSPVQKDWNGLPMILGTSIAGVLRRDFGGDDNDIFGSDNGSKVIFSNALLLDEKDQICEALLSDVDRSDFLKLFDDLPIREHTKIDHRGATGSSKDYSKFDEEVVYKGSRFKFSLEMIEDDRKSFEDILALLSSQSFRLGGGSTKGFGKFKIEEIKTDSFDINSYTVYSSSLNYELSNIHKIEDMKSTTHTAYTLKITPDDFFMFGSGFGDSDADMTPVYEKIIEYDKGKLSNKMILIPASSIKGALSHRTAFCYNISIEGATIESKTAKVDENNDAVKAIFGHKKEFAEDKKTELGQKAKILSSDCFRTDSKEIKTFDHVAIDRFTGGAINGALFQEKTIAQKDEWEIEILVENSLKGTEYLKAFKCSLDDICSGMLALGGATTKGHGVFGGELYIDGVKYEK